MKARDVRAISTFNTKEYRYLKVVGKGNEQYLDVTPKKNVLGRLWLQIGMKLGFSNASMKKVIKYLEKQNSFEDVPDPNKMVLREKIKKYYGKKSFESSKFYKLLTAATPKSDAPPKPVLSQVKPPNRLLQFFGLDFDFKEVTFENQFIFKNNDKFVPFGLEKFQKYMLEDYRLITPLQQIQTCKDAQTLIESLQQAWNAAKAPEKNSGLDFWQKELPKKRALAQQEENDRQKWLKTPVIPPRELDKTKIDEGTQVANEFKALLPREQKVENPVHNIRSFPKILWREGEDRIHLKKNIKILHKEPIRI